MPHERARVSVKYVAAGYRSTASSRGAAICTPDFERAPDRAGGSASAAEAFGSSLGTFANNWATVSEAKIEAVAGLLEDETARAILTQTSREPMSASELKQRCDASGPTIYRRLEQLRERDLIEEQTRPDPESGHHKQVYAPNLRRVTVELVDGELRLEIDRREDMSDRFTRLIENI
ncbi:ArsR/SmtB family transcription factor [Halolamina sp. R1-12]